MLEEWTLCIYGYMNVSAAGPMPVMEELVSERCSWFMETGIEMVQRQHFFLATGPSGDNSSPLMPSDE
ncbi:hypothetical protein EYF80_036104 [Liparis tanakae]|uniref:Uncharacterized protein n=1 Tax=Liparis tanakae TaxID=230148 RepID=A0A4Z2GJG0_9TELE|nr:hypothetical protein EYF80_036104 [Liparis tanakae]